MKWIFKEEQPDNPFDVKGFQQVLKNSSRGLRPVDLVAREVVQNSWDAYLWGFPEGAPKADRLRVEFRFVTLSGDDKKRFLKAIAWEQLVDIRGSAESDEGGIETYREIAEADDLSFLVASDWGAPGLYQSLEDPKSNWRQALFKLFGGKTIGVLGGSFGVGKTAYLKAGRAPVLAAYTCFAKSDSSTHTRRAQALAYWWNFIDGRDRKSRLGLGRLTPDDDAPALDEEADLWASSIGLKPRDPARCEEWGLDLVVLEPQFTAADLKESLENFWWPAIANKDFDIDVIDYDGVSIEVDPYEREELEPFLDTFRVIQDQSGLSSAQPDDSKWTRQELGGCILRPVQSPPSKEIQGPIKWGSHQIAMIRNTHMVLWYEKPRMPGALPAIQGCYVMEEADGSRLLRETEPGYHDKWETVRTSPEGNPKAYEFAERVLKAVRDHARLTFKAWTAKEADGFESPHAARALAKDLLRGSGVGGGTTVKESLPVKIKRERRTVPVAVKGDAQQKEGSCVFSAAWDSEDPPKSLVVRATARVIAGDGGLGPAVPCRISRMPEGFAKGSSDEQATGKLKRIHAEFGVQFGPYPAAYEISVRLEFRAA